LAKGFSVMPLSDRVLHPGLRRKIMPADEAAALIPAGAHVGMSGFTGAGYPKAVPQALAQRIKQNAQGKPFKIGLWTGASTAPELDGALAQVDGIEMRLPYQSDPTVRKQINNGQMQYVDIHLSHVAQFVWFGFLGKLDVAVVEVAGCCPTAPDPVVLGGQQQDLAGPGGQDHSGGEHLAQPGAGGHARHLLRHRCAAQPKAHPDAEPHERIGEPYLRCDPDKVIAVVHTDQPDRNNQCCTRPTTTPTALPATSSISCSTR
jgi:succinyl-CoA:acetate CoA-transferase